MTTQRTPRNFREAFVQGLRERQEQREAQRLAEQLVGPGVQVRDTQAFAQFLADSAAEFDRQQQQQRPDIGSFPGSGILENVARGAVGAGRFAGETASDVGRNLTPSFFRTPEGQAAAADVARRAMETPTGRALQGAEAVSGTSAGLVTEAVIAPNLSSEGLGRLGVNVNPNSFDAFIANLEAERQAGILRALGSNRAAFRGTEFAPGVSPLIEAVSDVTNLVPFGPVRRGLGLAGRETLSAAGTAARGTQRVAEGVAREAAAAIPDAGQVRRAVDRFSPIGTANAAFNPDDPLEIQARLDEISAALDPSGRIVDRPPWGRGLTDQELRAVARQEGVDINRADWWDGLDPAVIRDARQRRFRTPDTATRQGLITERRDLRRRLLELEQGGAEQAGEVVEEFDFDTGTLRPASRADQPALPEAAAGDISQTTPPLEQEIAQERRVLQSQKRVTGAVNISEDLERQVAQRRAEERLTRAAPTEAAIAKLTRQLRGARTLGREEAESIRSGEATRRADALGDALRRGDGEAAFRMAGGELSRPEFVQPVMQADEILLLLERIRTNGALRDFEKDSTRAALDKLLRGTSPAQGELALLERTFGKDLVDAFRKRPRTLKERASEVIVDVFGVPKTLRSAFDLSAPLRQGLLLGVANPREFGAAFRDMFRSFSKDKAFQINREIFDDPDIRLLTDRKGGNRLFLHPVEGAGPVGFTAREEAFISRYASKVPGVGLSERTYGTFLNKLRADVAKKSLNNWRRQGVPLTEARIDSLNRFINVFTGRGNLGRLEGIGDMLNIAFWSPRLLASRIQAPLLLADPNVRGLAAKNLAATFGTGATVLAIVDASGLGTVEKDPRSSDFGKIRIGRVRYDFWGGFQPIARYMAQIISNQGKSANSGRVYDISAPYIGGSRVDTGLKFLRSKLAPGLPALVANELFGETFLGEDLDKRLDRGRPPATVEALADRIGAKNAREVEALLQLAPLFALDLMDAVDEYGVARGGVMSIPSLFGVGFQNFNLPRR